MLNLHTHILVALFLGNVSQEEYGCAAHQRLAISDIVLWEIAKLMQKRRLAFDADGPEFQARQRGLTVIPITMEIARAGTQLDFSSDPADEIIAATSVVEKIPLLTRDRRILKSRIVPFAL